MRDLIIRNTVDENGTPAGGFVRYKTDPNGPFVESGGLSIKWQDGAIGTDRDPAKMNGAFLEDVIEACITRLAFFQGSKFACSENAEAIRHLTDAANALGHREDRRAGAGTLGTHEGS